VIHNFKQIKTFMLNSAHLKSLSCRL